MKRKEIGKKLGMTLLAVVLAGSSASAAAFAADTAAADSAAPDTAAVASDTAAVTPDTAPDTAAVTPDAAPDTAAVTPDTATGTAVPISAMLPDTAVPISAMAPEAAGQLKITMKTYQKEFKTQSGLVYKKISYQYPAAAGSSAAAKALNQFYKSQRTKWIKSAKKDLKEAKELVQDLAKENNSVERCYTDDVTCEVTYLDEDYISIVQLGYEYTLGAHGMPYRITYIFDAETGQKVSAAKLLGMTKQQLNTKVRKLYLNKFDKTKKAGNSPFYESRSEVKKTLESIDFNKNRYYLKDGKVRFYTDPYAVGPYAAGFIEVAVKVPKSNTLVSNASPDTSALALYVYDGKKVTRGFLFDAATEKTILASISAADVKKADNWTLDKVMFPVYALEIGGRDGQDLQAVWSNGYWIAQDGSVYEFDYDFGALAKGYSWTDKDEWASASVLPCARYLCQDGAGWNKKMLSPAAKLSAPDNITAELAGQTADSLTIKLANHGTEEWAYGEPFTVQVLLDGIWYDVPAVPGAWAFNSLATLLPAGKTQEKTYQLLMYGNLPAGNYRLVTEGMAVLFEVK